jgi:hypothetical protein
MPSLHLQGMPIFSPLSQRDWEKVEHLFIEKHFGKDDYIFFEGDPSSWLGVVLEGRVKMIKHAENGKDVVLDLIAPGEMLGEMAAFNGEPRPATAQAMEPTVVASIHQDDYCPGAEGDRGTGASAAGCSADDQEHGRRAGRKAHRPHPSETGGDHRFSRRGRHRY